MHKRKVTLIQIMTRTSIRRVTTVTIMIFLQVWNAALRQTPITNEAGARMQMSNKTMLQCHL